MKLKKNLIRAPNYFTWINTALEYALYSIREIIYIYIYIYINININIEGRIALDESNKSYWVTVSMDMY